jgi:ketosteroid isomerase-like protein
MSRENMEAVLRGLNAYNAGDLAAMREMYDPAAVMNHLEGWPEAGPSVGRDAVVRSLEGLREAWTTRDSLEVIGEPIDVGNRVMVRAVWHVSGEIPDQRMGFSVIFTFREGKVIAQEYFWSDDEALDLWGCRSSPEVALRTRGGDFASARRGSAAATNRRLTPRGPWR